jgi:hypothetical protein
MAEIRIKYICRYQLALSCAMIILLFALACSHAITTSQLGALMQSLDEPVQCIFSNREEQSGESLETKPGNYVPPPYRHQSIGLASFGIYESKKTSTYI